jgi:hypothetical protein
MSCTAGVLADSGRIAARGAAVLDRGGASRACLVRWQDIGSAGRGGRWHRQPGADGEPAAGTRPGIQGAA